MTHSPWSTAHTNTRSKAARDLPRASSPGSWQQGTLLSVHLPQKHTFISSRPCRNSKSYVCWKGFTLGSRGDGKGSRMDLKRLYSTASGDRHSGRKGSHHRETKHKPKQWGCRKSRNRRAKKEDSLLR